MTDVYYGTGCPEEVKDIFEFLGVEVEYEVSKFRNLNKQRKLRRLSKAWKSRYWNRRASAILELGTITKIRRE